MEGDRGMKGAKWQILRQREQVLNEACWEPEGNRKQEIRRQSRTAQGNTGDKNEEKTRY